MNNSNSVVVVKEAKTQSETKLITKLYKHKNLAFAGVFVFFGLLSIFGPRLWQDSSSKLLSVLPQAHYAEAATCTASATGNWSAAATWGSACNTGDTNKYPGGTRAGDVVIINANVTLTLDITPGFSVDTITFNNPAATGAIILNINTGLTLTTTGDVVFTANTGTLNQTIQMHGTGVLNIGGNLNMGNVPTSTGSALITTSVATACSSCQVNVTGTTTLANATTAVAGAAKITMTTGATPVFSTGTLAINGNTTGTGVATLSTATGTLTIGSGGINCGTSTAAKTLINVTGAGILNLGGNLTANCTYTIATTGTTKITASLTISGAYTIAGIFQVNTGTLTMGAAITNSGAVTIASGAILNLGAFNYTASSTTGVTGALCNTSNTGTKVFTGAITVNNPGVFDMTNTTSPCSGATVTGPTITISNNIIQNSNTANSFNAGAGTLTHASAQTFSGTGTGDIIFGQATFTLTSAVTLTNSYTGGQLLFTGATGISFANPSTTVATGLTLNNGTDTQVTGSIAFVANTRTVTQVLTLNGNATISASSITNAAPSGTSATGGPRITCGASATGSITTTGNVTLTPASTAAAVVTYAIGSCTLNVGGTLILNGSASTGGLVTVSATTGVIDVANGITFSGTVAKTLLTVTSSGRLEVTGTIGANGTITMAATSLLKTVGTSAINGAYTWGDGLFTGTGTTTTFGAGQIFQDALTVGDGTNATTLSTSNYALTVPGIMTIAASSTFNHTNTVANTSFGSLAVAGTLSGAGTAPITVTGDVSCGATCGTINLTGNTFEQRIGADANFGTSVSSDTTAWTFYGLKFSNSDTVSHTVTVPTVATGNITVTLGTTVGDSVDTAPTVLNAGNRLWTLSGTGASAGNTYPTIAGRVNSQTAIAATTHTINFDSTPDDGDLLIVVVGFDGAPGTITWPAGWTQLSLQANSTTLSQEIRYRVASGDSSSITLTTGTAAEMQGRSWRFSAGAYQGTPEVGTAATGTTANPNPPSVAPTWGSDANYFIAVYSSDGSLTTSVYPANYSIAQGSANSGGTTGNTIGYAGRQLTAASDDPGTFTKSTAVAWVAQTIAVRGYPVNADVLAFNASSTMTGGTSTFRYTGNAATVKCTGASYYDLQLYPTTSGGANRQILCATAGSTLSVAHNLTIGDGTHAGATGANTDPTINVTGNLTVASGTFVSTGGTLTVGGAFTVNGTFTHNNGAVALTTGSSLVSSGTLAFYDLSTSGTVTANGASGVQVDDNFAISSGTFTSTAGTLTISGNFTNSGTFTHNNGTVLFNNSSNVSTISGATTFKNLTVTTSGKDLRFTDGQTFAVAGVLTLTGATGAGNDITLNSVSGTAAWTINTTSLTSASVTYTTVTWSACTVSTPVIDMSGTGNTDGGNNGACWSFPVASFTIAGHLYSSQGSGALASKTIAIKVNGSGSITAVTDGAGAYSLSGVVAASGAVLTIYVSGATENANVVTISSGSALTNIDMYQNRVIVRYETGSSITNTDLDQFDDGNNSNNGDVMFTVTAGALTLNDGAKLLVWTGNTFAPGGTVTTSPDNSTTTVDGDVEIQSAATLSMAANALSVGGSFTNAGTFTNGGSQTTTFTATTTGQTITTNSSPFYNLTFNGVAGGWTLQDSDTVSNVLTITNGNFNGGTGTITLSGTGTPFINNGTYTYNTSTILYSNATAYNVAAINMSNSSGGTNGYYNLTTKTSTATPANKILGTAASQTLGIAGNFNVTQIGTFTGSGSSINASTYNPTINIAGNLILTAGNDDLSFLSTSGVLSIGGSLTQNVGSGGSPIFSNNSGTVNFNSTSTGNTINTNGNSFYNLTFNGVGGGWTFQDNTTVTHVLTITNGNLNGGSSTLITLSGTGTPFVNNGTFTYGTSTVVYTGNGATNIAAINMSNSSGGTNGYYNLQIKPAGATAHTLGTAASQTIGVAGNLTIGDGTHAGATGVTNNPAVTVAGNVAISAAATYTAGTVTLTIGGNFTNSGTFTHSSGTVAFTSTAGGKTITSGGSSFNNVTFNGSGGGWSPSGAMVLAGNLTMTAGTLSGTQNVTVNGGAASGNGTINMTGGTFLLDGAGNFGGTTSWTFNNLTFGDGTGSTTSTATGAGGITVSGTLAIAANQTLNAGSKSWTLSGAGTPFTRTGTFTAGTSVFNYTSSTGVTALASNDMSFSNAFYDLVINGSGQTFTAGATVHANGSVTVTAGTLAMGANILYSGNPSNSGSGSIKVASGQSLTQSTAGSTRVQGNGTNCIGSTGASCVGTPGTITFGTLLIGDNNTPVTTTIGGTTPTITIGTTLSLTHNGVIDAGTGSNINMTGNGAIFDSTDGFGNFIAGTSTVNFNSAATTGTTIPAATYYNVVFNKASNTFTVSSGTLNTNNLTITAGTLDLHTNDSITTVAGTLTNAGTLSASNISNLTINGDFTNNGTFTHNNGTVVLAPTTVVSSVLTSNINGSSNTTFYNLTNTTAGSKIKFKNGSTFVIANTLTATGVNGRPVYLNSDSSGVYWTITMSGSANLNYVLVQDANCSGGNTLAANELLFDQGHNGSCWGFIHRSGGGGNGDGSAGSSGSSGGGGSGGGGSGGGSGGSGGSTPPASVVAEVGNGSQRASSVHTGAGFSVSYPGSVTAGNLMVFTGASYGDSAAPASISVTDTLGTTWNVSLISNATSNLVTWIAYAIAPSSGANTVYLAFAANGNYQSGSIDEFSGVNTSSPLDADGGVSTGNDSTPTDSITTTTNSALVIGVLSTLNNTTYTPTYGTQIGEYEDNTVSQAHNAQFKIEATSGTQSVTWSLGSGGVWVARTASFKSASPPPGGGGGGGGGAP